MYPIVECMLLICCITTTASSYSFRESGISIEDGMWPVVEAEMDFGDEILDGVSSSDALHVIDVHGDMKVSPAKFHAATVTDVLLGIKCVKKGKKACSINCSQGKFLHSDGCCTCVCRKNFASVGSTSCHKASWSQWGKWSACMKSKWGGLQTRERICESFGKEFPGSCDNRGSMSKACTLATAAFKIRKNVRDLTAEEYHDLIQAMTKFKKDLSKRGYRNIISWHGWPGRCPWYHKIYNHGDNHCSWHHHPLFLPWHRLIMVQLELGLGRYMKNKTVGIPYWDWTEHNLDIPYLIRHSQIYDPVLKKYVPNPFHSNFIKYLGGDKIYSQRSPWLPGLLMDKYMLKGTVRALLSHNYFDFDDQLATNPHDQIHNCFCVTDDSLYNKYPRCLYAMPTVTYAAWDPVFMLHHSAIDRIFVMRRHLEEHANVSDWTSSRVAGEYTNKYKKMMKAAKLSENVAREITSSFSWPLSPFCNKSMNPVKETNAKGISTLHKCYYNEQLFGYKYSSFDLGSYTWDNLLTDFRRNVKDRTYWNDYYFDTKLGVLNQNNCKYLPAKGGCVRKYSNPV